MPNTAFDEVLVFCLSVQITSFEQVQNIPPKTVLKDPSAFRYNAASNETKAVWVDKKPLKGESFYAVVLVSGGKRLPVIIPSVNATVTGISPYKKTKITDITRTKEKEYYGTNITPLPDPRIRENDDGALSEKALSISESLSMQGIDSKNNAPLSPYIFKEDITAPQSGDDVFLFDILKTSFINEKYDAAARSLARLLRTNMTHSVTVRSSFYLGECYYFMGKYEKAINEFLAVQGYLSGTEDGGGISSLCKTWMDSSLDLLPLSLDS